MHPPLLRHVAVLAIAGAAMTLTACAAPGAQPASSTDAKDVAAAAVNYPVDVQNCGRTLHFTEAPKRIVSGWTTSTDLLVRLGLRDRVVGQYNTASGTADPEYAAAEATIPVLAENAPTKEQLVAAKPDLIWADGSYLFDGKQLPTIPQLNAAGIQVMILSGFCTDDATGAKVADVLTDLEAIGSIFGTSPSQQQAVSEVHRRLDAVADRVRETAPAPVAFISTYDRTVYAYTGVYSDMAARAGGRNIYADALPKASYYAPVSIEDLITKNPPTLVYLLSGGETPATAKTYLTGNLPTIGAVRNDRVVYLPSGGSTNFAAIDGVEHLSAALHPAP